MGARAPIFNINDIYDDDVDYNQQPFNLDDIYFNADYNNQQQLNLYDNANYYNQQQLNLGNIIINIINNDINIITYN